MFRYVALFLLVFAALASAQVNGSITGTVTDPTGSAIAGATVKLTSESTGAVLTATTNADGDFTDALGCLIGRFDLVDGAVSDDDRSARAQGTLKQVNEIGLRNGR